ncbi:unnamed protein product [Durusdinium trenchii]|uniref:Uncharacterized protein n=1 Tax=Durusdinium trenchii TaxID=1381693 RepID=A0ABP0N454_9DINO
MQLSSQHSQLPQTLLEELQELRSLASMPLPNLALDLAAFGDDVQLARQLLRQAFPAFDPPPERFFIGDDVEDDTEVEAVADAELSNSIIAKHLLRDVYMRIAQAPPEPLKQMVQTASAELQQLKAELAELREQVATMLAFFAYGEIAFLDRGPSLNAQIDAKSEEFVALLKGFLTAFEQCVHDSAALALLEGYSDADRFVSL